MGNTENGSVIIAQVGHSFDIYLESMVGSTGYGWCLKSLPKGVFLISTENIPLRLGIASVRQIFTFAAMNPLFDGLMEFELICLHNLSCESADVISFQIFVDDKKENDLLMDQIGGKKFYQGTGAMVHKNTALSNGFVPSENTSLLYGFPPDLTNGQKVIHSNANCLLKYGTPFGLSAKDSDCNIKYGYPIQS